MVILYIHIYIYIHFYIVLLFSFINFHLLAYRFVYEGCRNIPVLTLPLHELRHRLRLHMVLFLKIKDIFKRSITVKEKFSYHIIEEVDLGHRRRLLRVQVSLLDR